MRILAPALTLALLLSGAAAAAPPRPMEKLDRALVAVPAAGGGIHVDWRRTGTDGSAPRWILRRDGRVLTPQPIAATSFRDAEGTPASRYTVQRVGERRASAPATPWAKGYLSVPLQKPADRTTPSGERYSYDANDTSVGDLDGDGRYEVVVKWYPSIAKDNAFGGYSGETLLDAYTLDGRRLWRIDLGRNIRSGAHYTQFMVADYDGDGRAELMVKTADGTVDGTGRVLGDANADWREKGGERPQADRTGSTELPDGRRVARIEGRILKGPEYITVFDGRTGRALASQRYLPGRSPEGDNPTEAQLAAAWGDGYGNRSERYLAGVAYLDGRLPSGIFARGYYGRTAVAAWDWRGGKLSMRWLFDSSTPGNDRFAGQGNHQLATADIDGDGRQEIVYGSMALDDDGRGLWSAGLGHGDAMHVSDLDPSRPGLEKFGVHENMRMSGNRGAAMLDAKTGQLLWSTPATIDTGRGLAADIDPRHHGAETWASNTPDLMDVRGKPIPGGKPRAANGAIWWDGDRLRELLDGNRITKWDWQAGRETVLLDAAGTASNNGTKKNPALSADILGDWREELIVRSTDSAELRIYSTPYPSRLSMPTLMEDPTYRTAIAWQNTAYNQPPHPGFYLGADANGGVE